MATSIERQITLEGRRNVVVKWTGIVMDGNFDLNPGFSKLDCLNNDVNLVLTGFRVDLIEWSISAPLEVQLSWNGDSPQQIFPLAGRGKISAWNYGGFLPDQNRSGYDGSIRLTSSSFSPGTTQNFTIALELVKLYSR